MLGFGSKDKEETTEENKPGPWGSAFSGALSDARKAGVGAKERAKAGTTKGGKAGSGENLSSTTQEQITKLFKPDMWKPIVKAPFAFGQALTGRKCWEPTEKEVDSLSVSTSTAMEYVAVTDPKWLAIGMCMVSWTMILSEKFILNARERAKELAENPPVEPVHPQANGSTHHPLTTVK